EIESKPESLDRLHRRLIQLKIEREAVKKDTDESAKRGLARLDDEIRKLEREYADLEDEWKAEKAQVEGSAGVKEELERAKLDMDAARRAGDLARMAELQYGKIPELEKKLKAAQAAPAKKKDAAKEKARLVRTSVGEDEIAEVVSRWTGIPVSKLMEG